MAGLYRVALVRPPPPSPPSSSFSAAALSRAASSALARLATRSAQPHSNARRSADSAAVPTSSAIDAGSFVFSPSSLLPVIAAVASATAATACGERKLDPTVVAILATDAGGDARIRKSCRRRSDISRMVRACSLCSEQNKSAFLWSRTLSYATSAFAADSASELWW